MDGHTEPQRQSGNDEQDCIHEPVRDLAEVLRRDGDVDGVDAVWVGKPMPPLHWLLEGTAIGRHGQADAVLLPPT